MAQVRVSPRGLRTPVDGTTVIGNISRAFTLTLSGAESRLIGVNAPVQRLPQPMLREPAEGIRRHHLQWQIGIQRSEKRAGPRRFRREHVQHAERLDGR